MKKEYFSYVFAVIFIGIAIVIISQENYLEMMKTVTAADLGMAVFICAILQVLAGWKIGYLTSRNFSIHIKPKDYLLIPIMSRFWSYLIPMKGGLLFLVLFIKMKYKVKIVEGLSIGIFKYLIIMIIAGLAGLYYSLKINFSYPGIIISILLIINPLIFKTLGSSIQKYFLESSLKFNNFKKIVNSVLKNSNLLVANLPNTIFFVLITILHLSTRTLWLYWASAVFALDVPVNQLVLLAFILEFSVVIRFIPGNLGVEELLSGGTLSLFGGSMGDGVLMVLFLRLSEVLLTFTVGTLAVISQMKYFEMKTIKSMWLALRQPQPEGN